MTARVDRDICCYCGGCTSVCPTMALKLDETYIKISDEKCKSCGTCVTVCPVSAIEVVL